MSDPPDPGDSPNVSGKTEAKDAGYELLDTGVRRKLERYGPLTIDRPAPGAEGFRLAPSAWARAELRFDAGPGWSGPGWPAEPWPVEIGGLTVEVRPTDSGGVGLYPEHAANLPWLEEQVVERLGKTESAGPPQVLNLFAHTGLATLAIARAGAVVAHVDGARSAVAWAHRNAALSNLDDRPIRWLVDDAAAFVAREARRRRRYDGIVLDPPAFGRANGRQWRLEDDLPNLLAGCRAIAAPAAFLLLTAHSDDVDGQRLADLVRTVFRGRPGAVEIVPLELQARSGAHLALGWSARFALATRLGP